MNQPSGPHLHDRIGALNHARDLYVTAIAEHYQGMVDRFCETRDDVAGVVTHTDGEHDTAIRAVLVGGNQALYAIGFEDLHNDDPIKRTFHASGVEDLYFQRTIMGDDLFVWCGQALACGCTIDDSRFRLGEDEDIIWASTGNAAGHRGCGEAA